MTTMTLREYKLDSIEMRKAFVNTLLELAQSNSDIIGLDADLMAAIGTDKIKDQIPDQLIDCGIMEGHMISAAAGLSLTGKIPFVHTFAQFATRRAYDQLFISGAYAQLNIKILGSDAGVSAEHNGGTHMPFEDIGLMRLVPHATVYEASDATMLSYLLKQVAKEYGIHYIRTIRKSAVKIYDDNETFEKGKGKVLREGNDVTLIASGIEVVEALKAADILAEEGIEATVVDMFCIKPIDEELIVRCAKQTKGIVTCENHNVIGGLGSAVAEVLCEQYPAPLHRIGVKEQFGQVGQTEYLKQVYELTAEDIAKAARKFV